MEPITSTAQVVSNLLIFDSYRTSSIAHERSFFEDRLRLGRNFVAAKIGGRYLFAPSRFAGYVDCTAVKHQAYALLDGKITTPAITKCLGAAEVDEVVEHAYLALCEDLGVVPTVNARRYWSVAIPNGMMVSIDADGDISLPGEDEDLVEGATKRVVVNAYERNPKARALCIQHHGCRCAICGFDFSAVYGEEIGRGFIHVHHTKPISEQAAVVGVYVIDPINDLVPVCPNCHAMLHSRKPPYTVLEIKEFLNSAARASDASPGAK